MANRPKTNFFPSRPKICRPTKKHKNAKCLNKHSLQLLFNMFYCENNKKKLIAPEFPQGDPGTNFSLLLISQQNGLNKS